MPRGLRLRVPDGWPGLVGIAALVGGTAFAVGTPRVSDVGGLVEGDYFFVSGESPDLALQLSGMGATNREADAAAAGLGEDGFNERSLTLVGTFDNNADARQAAAAISVQLPSRTLIVDRLLVIYHLAVEPEDGPVPLVATLEDLGADVLVQGDRFGEGQVIVDLSCRAVTHDAAEAIATELADYGLGIPGMRPPWVGPALTDDETLARSTYRRWTESLRDAFVADPWMADYADRFLEAGSAAEYAALNAELEAHISGLPGRGIEGAVHPEVIALLVGVPMGSDPGAHAEWQRQLSRYMGPLTSEQAEEPTWLAQRQTTTLSGSRAVDDRVELGWIFFNRFELGFTGLLAYLEERNCDEVLVRLMDWDDVRMD